MQLESMLGVITDAKLPLEEPSSEPFMDQMDMEEEMESGRYSQKK